MNWIIIKLKISNLISTSKLKNPKIRMNALRSVEELISCHYPSYVKNPDKILLKEKSELVNMLEIKKGNSLNGAEKFIVNNIYKYLKTEDK